LAAGGEGVSIKISANLMTLQKACLEYIAVSLTARAADFALGGDKRLFLSFADSPRQGLELTGHYGAPEDILLLREEPGLWGCVTHRSCMGSRREVTVTKARLQSFFSARGQQSTALGAKDTCSGFKGAQPLLFTPMLAEPALQ